MNILYKYYSSDFDLNKHLQTPSIKLATTKSLNDPFERQLTSSLAVNLTDKYMQRKETFRSKEEIIESYTKISEKLGIVSLTETHRNLLMWAHYASSHRGICIGYKNDFFQKLEKNGLPKAFTKLDFTPQKVRYDSKRFDQDEYNNDEATIDLIMKAISKKSDEWIYEKEYRCIVPFTWADKFIKLDNKNSDLNELIKENRSLKKIKRRTFKNKSKNKIEAEYIYTDNIRGSKSYKEKIALHDNVVTLKNIDIESIRSIYLGSQYGLVETINIMNFLKSDPERYEHIKLFKYEINDNSFSLDALPLNSKELLSEEIQKKILFYQL